MRWIRPNMLINWICTCGRIMGIAQRSMQTSRINICGNTLLSNIKNVKRYGINIVVNNYNTLLSRFNQFFKQHTRLKKLTIEENLFDRRKIGLDEKINFLLMLCKGGFDGIETVRSSVVA